MGTVRSSIDDVSFDLEFTVKTTTLRIMALPSILPEQTLSAGDRSGDRSTFLSIYNVDASSSSMTWSIPNCVTIAMKSSPGIDSANVTVAFDKCASTTDMPVQVGKSQSVLVKFYAPTTVGVFQEAYAITSHHGTTESAWNVASSVIVVASEAVASTSSAVILGQITAGQAATVLIHPKDVFGNEISGFHFGLVFLGTATSLQTGVATTFVATYDFTAQLYSVELLLSRIGVYDVEFNLQALDPVASAIAMQCTHTLPSGGASSCSSNPVSVLPVVCQDTVKSTSNDDGNRCVCNEGFARIGGPTGECDKCEAGQQPREGTEGTPGWLAREGGCVTCPNGKASTSGDQCTACPVGERPVLPNPTGCEECPYPKYFDSDVANACIRCLSGYRVNSPGVGHVDDGGSCVECQPGHHGVDGECEQCADGHEPDDRRIACIDCAPGFAGKGGICERCPPGTEGKLSGTKTNIGDECTKCELTVSRDGKECSKVSLYINEDSSIETDDYSLENDDSSTVN